MELTEAQIQRYSRHILLPQMGGEGQRRLLSSSAAIAFAPEGAGAAAVAAVYLVAGGLGRIGWWPLSPAGAGAAAPEAASLAGLLDLYAAGGAEASAAALNPDARLEVIEGPEAVGGYDLLILLGGGASLDAAAQRFEALGKPLLRGKLRGWAGAVVEGAEALELDGEEIPPGEEEPLPPAPAEGVHGAMLASAALCLLLRRESPVGSTAQARFDLSRGRIWAASR